MMNFLFLPLVMFEAKGSKRRRTAEHRAGADYRRSAKCKFKWSCRWRWRSETEAGCGEWGALSAVM
eukprot:scaffold11522_cov239-Ochromonas_danica.AAC.15